MKRFFSIALTLSFVVAVVFCSIGVSADEWTLIDLYESSYGLCRSDITITDLNADLPSDSLGQRITGNSLPLTGDYAATQLHFRHAFQNSWSGSNASFYSASFYLSPGVSGFEFTEGYFYRGMFVLHISFPNTLLQYMDWSVLSYSAYICNGVSVMVQDFEDFQVFTSSEVDLPIVLSDDGSTSVLEFTFPFEFVCPYYGSSYDSLYLRVSWWPCWFSMPVNQYAGGNYYCNHTFFGCDLKYADSPPPVDPDDPPSGGGGTIDDITDYQPIPVLPDGSDSVSDAGDLEDDILEDQEDNLAEVSRTITNLVQPFSYFTSGLSFVQQIFDYMVPTGTWQHYLLLVSLGLGVACYVLNIAHRLI